MPRNPEYSLPEDHIDNSSTPFALTPEPFAPQDFEERNKANRNSRRNKTFDPPIHESRVTKGLIVNWKAAHHYDAYDVREDPSDPSAPISQPGEFSLERLHEIYEGTTSTGQARNVYEIFDQVPAKSMAEVRLRNKVNREHTMLAGTEYLPARFSGDD